MTMAFEYHEGVPLAVRARLGAAAIAAAAPAIIVRRSTFIPRSPLVAGASICESTADGNGPRPHYDSRAHDRGRRPGAPSEEPRRVHRSAGGAGESAGV